MAILRQRVRLIPSWQGLVKSEGAVARQGQPLRSIREEHASPISRRRRIDDASSSFVTPERYEHLIQNNVIENDCGADWATCLPESEGVRITHHGPQ